MYDHILVPVDGSPTSRRGLIEATRLAKALNAAVRLVHIVDETPLTLNPEAATATAPLLEQFAESGKQVLQEAAAAAQREGVQVETAMYENLAGRVADRILDEAANWPADLIVMGTHGRRGIRHAVLGSDAEAVVRSAKVPVLLVRSPEGQ
jgi:nucleotide-binding universal stress UspA family protein